MATMTQKAATSQGFVPAASEESKEKKSHAPRRLAKDLIASKGNKGVLAVMVQVCMSLASKNDYKGTKLEGSEQSQHSSIYQITRDGGRLDSMDEKSEAFKNLLAKGKLAYPDVTAEPQVYSKKVEDFINEVTKLQNPVESKIAALRGIKFA